MGVVIKQSFWGTILTYVGVTVGFVNTLYVRADNLELDQIGIFTLITANAMIISPMASLGMSSSFLKYFSAFEKDDRNSFFSLLFLVTILGNIIVLILGYLFLDVIASRYIKTAPVYSEFLYITGIIIVANTMFELFLNYSRTIMDVIFPVFLREVFLRTGSLILILGYSLQLWEFNHAIMGLGAVYLIAFLLLFIHLVFKHKFWFNFNFKIISLDIKHRLLMFGTYSMLMAGSFALVNNITNDQLATILGADMAGIFNTCFFIAVIVELPRRNMANVVAPIISSHMESNTINEVERIYKRSSITMAIMGALLFIGITTNISDLYDFIPKGDSFSTGFWIVISVCFAKLLNMGSSFSGEIINFSIHYKYNLLFQVMAAITLILLNYFLIPIYGLNGAAMSYLITISFHLLLKGFFVWIKFKIQPFIKSHITLLFITTSVWLFAYLFGFDIHPAYNIAIRAILTTILFTLLIYKFNISQDINLLIRSTFERLKNIIPQ